MKGVGKEVRCVGEECSAERRIRRGEERIELEERKWARVAKDNGG